MRILVTGGAGFIGSHVVDAYVQAGHDVWVVDDLSRGKRENVNPAARLKRMDLRSPDMSEFIATHEFDCIDHHAGQVDVRASVADPVRDAMINVVGTLNLLEAARNHGSIPVILASTGGAIYGEQKHYPATEGHPIAPQSPYGVAKRAIEHYLEYYRQVHGLPYVVLRYANVYGPRQDPEGEAGVIAIFSGRILRSERLVIYGSGEQTRDYVYVGDVARANVLALNHLTQKPASSRQPSASANDVPKLNNSRTQELNNSSQPSASANDNNSITQELNNSSCQLPARIFNIGTGIETSVNALAAMLLDAAGADCSIAYHPIRRGEQVRSCIDPAKAEEHLGWSPLTALPDGLTETFAWFRKQQQRSRALASAGAR
jgi:UDP-glucose 4-epimerase